MYTISRDCLEDKSLSWHTGKERADNISNNAGASDGKVNNRPVPCAKDLLVNGKIVNFLSQLAGSFA